MIDSAQPISRENRLSISSLSLLIIYLFINTLFVFKYAPDFSLNSIISLTAYLLAALILIIAVFRDYEFSTEKRRQGIIYLILAAIATIFLAVLMFQFNPDNIEVGRYPALHDWITRLLDGQFPYSSSRNPSGFPMLFILALPFYLLGDLGFFQILSFVLFALFIYYRFSDKVPDAFRIILLLVASPIFGYEIVVRSELFSNMIIIIVYLAVLERLLRNKSFSATIALGIIGGLLLSTRGIVLLIYIVFFGYLFRYRKIRYSLFIASMLAGFILTLAPFMIWNWGYFISSGPFSIQLSYIPGWLLVLAILSSVACAVTARSWKRTYTSISFILFGVVFVTFIFSALKIGLSASVIHDRFDISYFSFSLPFLLLSLNFPKKRMSSA